MAAGRGPGTGGPSRETGGRPAARDAAGRRPGAGSASRTGVRPAAAVAARAVSLPRPAKPTRLRRLAALGVIAVVLTVLLAPAVRSYLAQRQQINELTAQVADQRAEVAALQRQRSAWDDPAFVKAQARERLKFVLPGERAYTVIDPGSEPKVQPAGSSGHIAVPPAGQERAWFGTLWRSAEIAGTAAAPR